MDRVASSLWCRVLEVLDPRLKSSGKLWFAAVRSRHTSLPEGVSVGQKAVFCVRGHVVTHGVGRSHASSPAISMRCDCLPFLHLSILSPCPDQGPAQRLAVKADLTEHRSTAGRWPLRCRAQREPSGCGGAALARALPPRCRAAWRWPPLLNHVPPRAGSRLFVVLASKRR